jgi:hypothetical protein
MCTAVLSGWDPATLPPALGLIWSAKIDDFSLWPSDHEALWSRVDFPGVYTCTVLYSASIQNQTISCGSANYNVVLPKMAKAIGNLGCIIHQVKLRDRLALLWAGLLLIFPLLCSVYDKGRVRWIIHFRIENHQHILYFLRGLEQ